MRRAGAAAVVIAVWMANGMDAGARQGADAAATPMSRFGWLAGLAGSCWTGTRAGGETSDTQCYEVQFGRFLRGTIELPPAGGAGTGFQGDSVFAWDDRAQRIAYWVWGSDGNFSPGEAYLEGELIRFPARRREGSTAPETRSTWTRLDADSFRVVRERKEGESWAETMTVVYRRTKPVAR